jgi:hypothetical protein
MINETLAALKQCRDLLLYGGYSYEERQAAIELANKAIAALETTPTLAEASLSVFAHVDPPVCKKCGCQMYSGIVEREYCTGCAPIPATTAALAAGRAA